MKKYFLFVVLVVASAVALDRSDKLQKQIMSDHETFFKVVDRDMKSAQSVQVLGKEIRISSQEDTIRYFLDDVSLTRNVNGVFDKIYLVSLKVNLTDIIGKSYFVDLYVEYELFLPEGKGRRALKDFPKSPKNWDIRTSIVRRYYKTYTYNFEY